MREVFKCGRIYCMKLRFYLVGLLVAVFVVGGYFFGGYLAKRSLQVEIVSEPLVSPETKTEVLKLEEEVVVESEENEAVDVYNTAEESYDVSSSSEPGYQEGEGREVGLQSL